MMGTVQLHERPTAVVHERVPTTSLPEFFSRAFTEVAAELSRQGTTPGGPPFALYRGRSNDLVDVEAGFPVTQEIEPEGAVTPSRLPGGAAVQAMHLGPYDRLESTYELIRDAISESGHQPADLMWETYLSPPGQDPQTNQTLVTWPFMD